MSGVRLSRALLPHMLKQNWGRIIFISSESGLNIPAEMVNYGMTKTAQLALSRGIAESIAGSGVTVNAVLPGPTLTEGVSAFVESLAKDRGISVKEMEVEMIKSLRPSSLIKRWATPEEWLTRSSTSVARRDDRRGGSRRRRCGPQHRLRRRVSP